MDARGTIAQSRHAAHPDSFSKFGPRRSISSAECPEVKVPCIARRLVYEATDKDHERNKENSRSVRVFFEAAVVVKGIGQHRWQRGYGGASQN